MKKVYIIAALMVGISIFLFVKASGEVSTYGSFAQAKVTGERVKITGQLAKEKEMVYDPQTDPNYFSFYIRDNDGITQKVILLQPRPQDFELSEQIVLTGRMKDEVFLATDVLLKCPSKYKDEEMYLQDKAAS
jgi:cytochrome c-type biogenesis protein CcmE